MFQKKALKIYLKFSSYHKLGAPLSVVYAVGAMGSSERVYA